MSIVLALLHLIKTMRNHLESNYSSYDHETNEQQCMDL